eukprot:scaffold62531_cov30-Tisochrysis_lutea.AAC.1
MRRARAIGCTTSSSSSSCWCSSSCFRAVAADDDFHAMQLGITSGSSLVASPMRSEVEPKWITIGGWSRAGSSPSSSSSCGGGSSCSSSVFGFLRAAEELAAPRFPPASRAPAPSRDGLAPRDAFGAIASRPPLTSMTGRTHSACCASLLTSDF